MGVGYDVQSSDLLPDVPGVAGLDALGVGGPIWHIKGTFGGGAKPLIDTSTAVVGGTLDLQNPDLLTANALVTAVAAGRSCGSRRLASRGSGIATR